MNNRNNEMDGPEKYSFEIPANGQARTFVPRICVPHRWKQIIGPEGEIVAEYCIDTGAVCTRDERGMIVEYDRLAEYKPGRTLRISSEYSDKPNRYNA